MKGLFQLLAIVCLLELAFCWKNKWDQPLNFQCPSGQVIAWMRSIHDNHREDRLYDFGCTNKCPKPNVCHWTGYLNNFDQRVDFVCPYGGIISGFKSYHSNHHEDRRWRVYCCRSSLRPVNCKLTHWLNNWDGPINYRVPSGYIAHGIFSYHRNDKEDRVWKLLICQYKS